MLKRIGVVALVGTQACAVAEGPVEREPPGGAQTVLNVQIGPAETDAEVVQRIVATAHPHLVDACASDHGSVVRVMSAIASDVYTDVPCADVLWNYRDARTIHEPTGEAQQAIGPISFLMCGLYAGGSLLALRYAVCPRARTERDRRNCEDTGLWGGVAMGILCSIPL